MRLIDFGLTRLAAGIALFLGLCAIANQLLFREGRHHRLRAAGSLVCGVVLAGYISRAFFVLAPDHIHANHEKFGYVYRLIDFREAVASGHLFPQWSTYMRGGLGEPYWSYYQPGFFYLASLLPHGWEAVRTLGLAVFIASLIGFLGMSRLVGARFGGGPGLLAPIILLLSGYSATEIYLRGDLAEYTAMMLLPFLLHCLLAWDEHRRSAHAVGVALCAAALIVTHASVGLMSYMVIAGAMAISMPWVRRGRDMMVSALPLLAGVILSAFYWFPVFFEWKLVQPESAFAGFYDFRNQFVSLASLWGGDGRPATVVPFSLGRPILVLAAVNLVRVLGRWKGLGRAEQSLLVLCGVVVVEATFMMTRWSLPVWELLPLLHRVQFPWRFLSIVTVMLAVFAGLWVPKRGATAGLWVLGVALLLFASTSDTRIHHVMRVPLPERPGDLVALDYRPDLEGEWVPRGAPIIGPGQSPGVWQSSRACRTDRFSRAQSRLNFTVDAGEDCDVVVPHYYFPVGWRALAGRQELAVFSHRGFLALHVPAGTRGDVTMEFTTTPMKRWGVGVSLLSLFAGLAWLLTARRRHRPRGPLAAASV